MPNDGPGGSTIRPVRESSAQYIYPVWNLRVGVGASVEKSANRLTCGIYREIDTRLTATIAVLDPVICPLGTPDPRRVASVCSLEVTPAH